MPCAAAQIQPACRTVGQLGGVPFRLLGDRERPVFRAEGAIETVAASAALLDAAVPDPLLALAAFLILRGQ
jgi:hypothetical protein